MNTDPKKLDESNIGDAVTIKLTNGSQQSALLKNILGNRAYFEWKTGPRQNDVSDCSIHFSEWDTHILTITAAKIN